MPRINFKHVVTFSSEDPNHPASNLLNGETIRKWRCKSEGEAEACVTLRLEKAVEINSIDIGNNGSAFVEVQVSRTDSQPQIFETLLPAAAFMSPTESRNNTNLSRVKMFGINYLNKVVASQKWDLVKIVCTQQFNRHIQYGISFIALKGGKAEEPVTGPGPGTGTIGGFRIKPSADAGVDPIKVGSYFNKRNTQPEPAMAATSPASTAALLRGASAALMSSGTTGAIPVLLGKHKLGENSDDTTQGTTTPPAKKLNANTSNDQPKTSTGMSPRNLLPKSQVGQANVSNTSPKPKPSTSKVGGSSMTGKAKPALNTSKSPATSKPQKKLKKSKPKRKPFNKLFEDVVFVISGYENPYRTNMRNLALEMGAVCKRDWDITCTHLICAFPNTPKFKEVRRSRQPHTIVKMKWIEDSYRRRRRLAWRKYFVDRADQQSDSDSEDEILALSGDEEESVASSNDENFNNNSEDGKEEEDGPKAKTCSPGGAYRKLRIYTTSEEEDDLDEPEYGADTDTDLDNPIEAKKELSEMPEKIQETESSEQHETEIPKDNVVPNPTQKCEDSDSTAYGGDSDEGSPSMI